MAGASPGLQNKEEMPHIFDDFGECNVRCHGTPPRRPKVEGEGDQGQPAAQADATGQPTGGGGPITINYIAAVASERCEEMYAVRNSLETELAARALQGPIYVTAGLQQLDVLYSCKECTTLLTRSHMQVIKEIEDTLAATNEFE